MEIRERTQFRFIGFVSVWLWGLSAWGVAIQGATVLDNDDPDTVQTGSWRLRKGKDAYLRKACYARGDAEFRFTPRLPAGEYEVSMWWSRGKKLSDRVPVTIHTSRGAVTLEVDQSVGGGRWNSLGVFSLDAGSEVHIQASRRWTTCADAVRFERVSGTEDPPTEPPSPPPDDPPAPPLSLVPTAGDDFVALDWADSPEMDFSSYAVYRSETPDGGFGPLAAGLTTSALTDREVAAGTAYYYFATAIDQAGNESGSSDVVMAEVPLPPDRSVHLAWSAPTANEDGSELTDLDGYFLHYGYAPGQYSSKIDVGDALEYRFDSMDPGIYYFAVTARDTAGNESAFTSEVWIEIE